MWLCVDRIEGDTVTLLDDSEGIYRLSRADYTVLVGTKPVESDILAAEVAEDRVISAAYDEAETKRRKEAARARLDRLFGKQ